MKDDKAIEKDLGNGWVANIAPYDDCCYRLFVCNNEYTYTGIWCPKTFYLAVDGEIVGIYETKEEVLESIKIEMIETLTFG